MARKRIIDPEFWTDQEIGFWSFKARLFYIGLWNFSDDEGLLKAHDALLKAQIFPYELTIDIPSLKKEIADKVQWYEVNGQQYGYIRNFLRHQRIDKPSPSKLPHPELFDDVSTNTPRYIPPNTTKEKLSKENGADPVLVRTVFEYFCLKLNKKILLSSERSSIISNRFKEGRTLEEMKIAIDNFSKDDWPDRHKYCDILYCLGTRNKINNMDKWLSHSQANGGKPQIMEGF